MPCFSSDDSLQVPLVDLLIAIFGSRLETCIILAIIENISGFSGGAFVMAAPAYIAEIAETKWVKARLKEFLNRSLQYCLLRYRGALGTCMQLMVTLGIFFVNLNCETDWRLFSGICIVFPAVLGLWMFWMPRSPIFLVSKIKIKNQKSKSKSKSKSKVADLPRVERRR